MSEHQVLGGQIIGRKSLKLKKRYQEFQEKAEDSLFLIAEIGSEPVGYHWIDLERANDTIVAHVKGLGVLDGFRRRGIAAALKLRGEKWCIERNCRVIKTNVHYNNKAMLDWNVRQGFEPGFVELYKPINNARWSIGPP
jgi:GNAT superfamily N-acetyltransferase